MNRDFMKIVMNPIRQRIIQYLMIHGQGTSKEMMSELTDIPPASLYRHVKVLAETGCIEIAEEHKIRGTVEKTWKLCPNPLGDFSLENTALMLQNGLLTLMADFQKYFASENPDPEKDFLSFSTSTLLLTDEEFLEMMQKIGNIFNEVIYNKPENGRKPRRITFISSPCEKED